MQDCSLYKIAHTISKLTKTIFGTKMPALAGNELGRDPQTYLIGPRG
jgi:hypothetical protein